MVEGVKNMDYMKGNIRKIDAEALQKRFNDDCATECAICKYYKEETDPNNGTIFRCGLVDEAPTIETPVILTHKVKEGEVVLDFRKHAHWNEDDWSKIIECSECRGAAPIDITSGAQYKSNFCQSCGAVMDEEEEGGSET